MRYARAAWLLLFLIPLTWWADRGCNILGVDPIYHATVWMHERLGWAIAFVAAASALTVAWNIFIARRRFSRMLALAEPMPERLARACALAAGELAVALPRIAYLNVPDRIASTVFSSVVVFSRGFLDRLDDHQLLLVARHELVHASRRHGTIGVLWHLAFSALLLPGFEPLERRLHALRERRANIVAAHTHEDAYLELLAQVASGGELCAGNGLGVETFVRRRADRWIMWVAPIMVVSLAVALPLSHAEFMHDRGFLLAHHC